MTKTSIVKAVVENERGVALLAVLWLAVALSFMAMATAQLVRTEVSAVTNQIDAQRSYYLARGGVDAAVYSIVGSSMYPRDPSAPLKPSEFLPGRRYLQFQFHDGSSVVEVTPENAKLNVNQATPEQLTALFASLGFPGNESVGLAGAIVDWRTPPSSDVGGILDAFYANLPEPYAAGHAPADHLEELLPVKGMSRTLFFGRFERTPEGQWHRWPPLADLLTVQSTGGSINANYAAREILRILPGWNDAMAAATLVARSNAPFRTLEDLQNAVPGVSETVGVAPLSLSVGTTFTLTATGSLPNSGVRRSVRALVVIGSALPLYHRVLSWWDEWPSPADLPEGTAENHAGNRNQL